MKSLGVPPPQRTVPRRSPLVEMEHYRQSLLKAADEIEKCAARMNGIVKKMRISSGVV